MIVEEVKVAKKNKKINKINYWKEVEEDLPILLEKINGIILITYDSMEFIDFINILKKINSYYSQNVLYISLVRSYHYMKNAIKLEPLDNKKITFIDCVSGYAFSTKHRLDEAIYHKPPKSLEEMKKIINYGIEKSNPDLIILDSLSQFINFSQTSNDEINQLYDFIKSIKKNTLKESQNSIILLYDSKLKPMKNLPKDNMDLILKIEVLKEENISKTNIIKM